MAYGNKTGGKVDVPMKPQMAMETPAKEKAEAKTAPKSTHKPGTKKYCPTCNRSVSCPHM